MIIQNTLFLRFSAYNMLVTNVLSVNAKSFSNEKQKIIIMENLMIIKQYLKACED